MNRLLIPLALVVLVAGCAMPNLFGQQAGQPVADDSAQTVVVREIYHETPVYYVDTVYMAEEPAPVQPVYVNEEHNEYNEYNETNVYVHEQVVVQPPHHRGHGWSPRERESRPRDGRGDDGSSRDRNQRRDQDKPKTINQRHPVQKVNAPAVDDSRKAPDRPAPVAQPNPPKRQAPARGGSVPVVPVQIESPKQAPVPPSDRPAVAESDSVQVQVGMSQAGTGVRAARVTK